MTAEVDASGSYTDDAHRSTSSWVQAVVNCSPAQARARVRAARMVRDLPAIGDALCDGHVGSAQIESLSRLHRNPRVASHLGDGIELLLEHASLLPQPDFVAVCQRFEAWADPDGTDRDHQAARQHRTMSQVRDGVGFRIQVRGDALTGSMIESALESFITAEFDADWAEGRERHGELMSAGLMARTPAQRRFDAFAKMCAAAGNGTGLPTVNIICDEHTAHAVIRDALDNNSSASHDIVADSVDATAGTRSWTGRRSETTTDHAPVSDRDLLTALLIGNVRKVVRDRHGRVIHLGRRRRLFTGAAREAALLSGDRWIHPGCHIRSGRIHIDHTIAWARTRGPTDPDNANIRCGPHNHAKEQHGHTTHPHPTMPNAWITRRNNGTVIAPRTSPRARSPESK